MPNSANERIRIIFFPLNYDFNRDCRSQPLVGNHGGNPACSEAAAGKPRALTPPELTGSGQKRFQFASRDETRLSHRLGLLCGFCRFPPVAVLRLVEIDKRGKQPFPAASHEEAS